MEKFVMDLGIMKPKHRKPIQYVITEDGCWECVSHELTERGYPRMKIKSSCRTISREVYKRIILKGEIPENLLVRHKCDNRLCINPEHLELGTALDNSRDMIERGRSTKGIKNGQAKLNDDKVREILNDTTSTLSDLARKYNVDPKCIRQIRDKITWKHVVL